MLNIMKKSLTIFVGCLILAVFFNLDSSLAGTLTAEIRPNGVIMLDADFSADFDCVPEYYTPTTIIAEVMGCYSVRMNGWTAHGERPLACPYPGRSFSYSASSSGGRYVNGVCAGGYGASATAYVVDMTATDIEIIAPEGRITKGIHDVDVAYDFKYDNADSCGGLTGNRVIGVSYAGAHGNLPVRGTESFSYNFSNSTGVVKLSAQACCNGHCANADKLVYVDPDDLGGTTGSGGGPGPAGPPPTCPGSGSTLVGKPVNLANGNVFISQTDFSLSEVILIYFTRYYNSKGTEAGGFYTKWRHTFDTKATALGNSYKIINADNSINYYMDNDSDGLYLPELPKGLRSTVIKNADDSLRREFYDGSKEEFNKYGYLTGIVDRNGNRITLTRDSSNKLVKITGPAGREINLTYDASKRITQISLPDGKTFGYTYISGRLQKVTYPDGTYRTYEYSGYNLTGIKDENGNYIEKHDYDSQERGYTSSVDGTNEKLTLSYLSDSQSTVTDSFGRSTTYTIDKTGGRSHATSLTGPGCSECGQGDTSYTYDDNLNVTSKTDANGNVTTMTYDADGNMLTKTEAYGSSVQRTAAYTYNEFGEVLTETDNEGIITSYTYDDNGNILTGTEANGTADERTTTYTYNAYGQVLTITDPNGNTTTNTYDQYDNLASATNELDQTITYTYDIMGNPLSMTDANGNTTAYEYDLRDRLKKETRPDTGIINYEYDPAGNRTAIIDANGNRTTSTYNAINQLITITDHDGNSTNYAYDTEGNMTSMTIKDTLNNVKTFETYTYDDHNRLKKTIHLDNTYTEQTYDELGNVLTKRDENGNITTFTYDALNRLKTVTDADERVTLYTYDSRDNLTSVTDANGNTTSYVYDSLSSLVSTTSPDTGTTTYTYDANGNILTKMDANGVTITYVYDEVNRQTAIQFPDATQNIYYYHDDPQMQNSSGRMTSMVDPSGTAWNEYDKMGRVTMETRQINDLNYRTGYEYDLNGNVVMITYPGGRQITYNHDQLNNVTSIADTYLGATRILAENITYLPYGDIVAITNGNGITTSKTYDSSNRLNSLTIGALKQLSYSKDNAGNITAITDALNPIKNKAYTYDALGRLTISTGPWSAITYAYDTVGNRIYETIDNGSTMYNYAINTNKLASSAGEKSIAFSYDNNGNTIGENGRQYVYNDNQRMIRVIEGAEIIGEYVYNGSGQRVKKYTNNGAQCRIFHYDKNGMLIAESSSSGTIKAEYIYINGQPLAKIEGDNIYHYHNDHLGTPMLMTDSSGTTVWTGEYLPFGEPYSVSGSITNNLRFPGQYYDAETGLNQNYFRDYKPEIGRYVEADPIGIEGGNNHLFVYVGNSPCNFMDPLGLEAELCMRDFYPLLFIPATHCYIRFNGNRNDTLSFDDKGVHPDKAPKWWPGQRCSPTKGKQDDECVKMEMKKCKAEDYNLTGFNCCHCAENALKSCGQSPSTGWPNWPINPGPQPGEPGYKP